MVLSRWLTLTLALGLVCELASPVVSGDLYEFTLSDEEGYPGGTAEVTLTLNSAAGEALSGYAMSVCNDALLSLDEDGADVVNGATVADHAYLFHAVTVRDNDLDSDDPVDEVVTVAVTIGTALSFGTTIDPEDDQEMYLINYSISTDAEVGEVLALEWCVYGDCPPLQSAVVLEDLTEIDSDTGLGFVDGSITVVEPPHSFIRGDANQDGRVDLADAVWEFKELFGDTSSKDCPPVNDANGDGLYNTADPVFILFYRFLEGAEPPAPFPDCGLADDTRPGDCLEFGACR